jgi:hypothetical protein
MAIWFKNLARKCNRIKEPSQKGFDDGYEIMVGASLLEAP